MDGNTGNMARPPLRTTLTQVATPQLPPGSMTNEQVNEFHSYLLSGHYITGRALEGVSSMAHRIDPNVSGFPQGLAMGMDNQGQVHIRSASASPGQTNAGLAALQTYVTRNGGHAQANNLGQNGQEIVMPRADFDRIVFPGVVSEVNLHGAALPQVPVPPSQGTAPPPGTHPPGAPPGTPDDPTMRRYMQQRGATPDGIARFNHDNNQGVIDDTKTYKPKPYEAPLSTGPGDSWLEGRDVADYLRKAREALGKNDVAGAQANSQEIMKLWAQHKGTDNQVTETNPQKEMRNQIIRLTQDIGRALRAQAPHTP